MTLRDWFAGQALAETMRALGTSRGYEGHGEWEGKTWRDFMAAEAYKMADAMIAARAAKEAGDAQP